ncbi:MAG: monofunctional biosynthetic peptidoglycan transglycosylase [Leptothrix ochracea]|uniref:monofunctional biosynthetic peptidoglycan transglycosylase n=1 Tax=Leptothrix ochracea TaxID=735331 RepID=UPI0034E262BC
MKTWRATAWRLLALLALSFLALQGFWLLRIGTMTVIDPQSTSFERSEAWRLITEKHRLNWSQAWRSYPAISDQLKRAVIASEDAGFTDHSGIEWDAIEKAWTRNQKAEARAATVPSRRAPPKIFGGSTITQQLAKNLFLSGERSVLRKAQEALITLMLEAVLDKQRILEIYLNHVEWGEGVFGAQAAAQHHFRTEAARLQSAQAARLAVMLPAPKRFEKQPTSAYLVGRSTTVMARMSAVDLP